MENRFTEPLAYCSGPLTGSWEEVYILGSSFLLNVFWTSAASPIFKQKLIKITCTVFAFLFYLAPHFRFLIPMRSIAIMFDSTDIKYLAFAEHSVGQHCSISKARPQLYMDSGSAFSTVHSRKPSSRQHSPIVQAHLKSHTENRFKKRKTIAFYQQNLCDTSCGFHCFSRASFLSFIRLVHVSFIGDYYFYLLFSVNDFINLLPVINLKFENPSVIYA